MRAIEQRTTGNFLIVPDDSQAIVAIISQSSRGWRVFSNNAARKNGRTWSATPEEAAQKYYGKKIKFTYLVSDDGVAR